MESERRAVVFPSALGWMSLVADEHCVKRLSFGHATPQEALAEVSADLADEAGDFGPLVRRLQQYTQGVEDDFLDVEIDCADLTPFQRRVIELCRHIPFGTLLTYGELAKRAGHPRAARAVGNCMRTARVPLIVPCHRVVGTSGDTRGNLAGEGIRMKLRLLEMESAALARAVR